MDVFGVQQSLVFTPWVVYPWLLTDFIPSMTSDPIRRPRIMRPTLILLLAFMGSFVNVHAQPGDTCLQADLVLHGGTVYTSDESQWEAEAVAALDDRIVFVGSNADAQRYMCGDAQIIEMSGNTIYAGFTDSHQHLEGVGRRTKTLSLFGIPTLEGTVQAIEEFAANVPEGQWVQGRGWIEREWTDQQRFLNKYDVDPFTGNKPLFMPRADGVSALVNSAGSGTGRRHSRYT
jgi:hypothetical protein